MKRKIYTSMTEEKLTAITEMKKKKQEQQNHIVPQQERQENKQALYRPPTTEEINELKENENLYKNNIFRMQIDCLLEEVRMKDKTTTIDSILHDLHDYLISEAVENASATQELSDSNIGVASVVNPLAGLLEHVQMKGAFKFQRPDQVKVIGSFLLKTLTKPNKSIDVLVDMPKECLQEKDHLNFRYLYKRALYLCHLADSLKSWEYTDQVVFSDSGNNLFKPTLHLTLIGPQAKKYSIRIHVGLPNEFFKLDRFSALKNNVRPSWYFNGDSELPEDSPTPHYNSSVLSDLLCERHLEDIYNLIQECPAAREAIILLKVWLEQRRFKGNLQMNGFIGSMLCVYLLKTKKISPHMSSYQIFRIVLLSLASDDWRVKGVSLCPTSKSDDADMSIFHEHFDVVFVDSSGFLNLCYNVDGSSYEMIRREAKLSLDFLDNSGLDGFELLFMKPIEFLHVTDHFFTVSRVSSIDLPDASEEKVLDNGGVCGKIVLDKIIKLAQKGLGDRIKFTLWKQVAMQEWDLDKSPVEQDTFQIGLCLDTENYDRLIDMGPAADDPESAAFRTFWGGKAELRRFQDGSINEAVVWKCSTMEQRKMICSGIVEHLLSHHLQIPQSNVAYHGSELNSLLKCKIIQTQPDTQQQSKKSQAAQQGSGEEESVHFLKIFNDLKQELRALEGLPLQIRSIDGIEAAFRFTKVIPPRQRLKHSAPPSGSDFAVPSADKKAAGWTPCYKVAMQLESSGKWPDDMAAVQHIRAAFHVKLASLIKKNTRMQVTVSSKYIDVCKCGYVFRISIVHPREALLYQESTAVGQLKKDHDEIFAQLDTDINKKPAHTSLIHSFAGAYRAYAETCRLCTRWVSSQMLSGYLPSEAVELLVARLFINPEPLTAPGYHTSAFLRFLHLLATFDWQKKPLVVNLNSKIESDELLDIEERFTTNRDQHCAMHLVAPYDLAQSTWTRQVDSQILRRITALSSAASALLKSKSSLDESISRQLFRPSLSDYDLVIKLQRDQVPRHHESADSQVRVAPPTCHQNVSHKSMPVVDYDPAQRLLAELTSTFSDIAMFFYDEHGGLAIGVVWKAGKLQEQSFKILNAAYKCIVPAAKDTQSSAKKSMMMTPMVGVNIPAVISDMHVMGRGVVSDIVINS